MRQITYKENIPDYALSYLINDDTSSLTADEIEEIDVFMDSFYLEAANLHGHVVIDIIDDESSFNHRPGFGLACDTVTCNINILY